MIRQLIGNVTAEIVDAIFQLIVEQITDHGHTTAHPLPGTTKLGVAKLSHGAVAVIDRN